MMLSSFPPPPGMDSAEQCTEHCAEGQPSPATVCGEVGENPQVYDQRESSHHGGSGQTLGRSGLFGNVVCVVLSSN